MAVTSHTEIQNSALIKLGQERILDESDESNRARLVREQYPKVRDALLRAHPWKFARGRADLAVVSPIPDNFSDWDFDYVYQLPSDCMRVLSTNMHPLQEWDVEQRYLAANQSSVKIKYIKRITDVTKFDDNFCEVLAWALAADIAYALTGSTTIKDETEKRYQQELALARSFNAQQGSVQRVASDEWLDSRYY